MIALVVLPWPAAALSPNARGHWAKKSRATSAYRTAAFVLTQSQLSAKQRQPFKSARAIVVDLEFLPPGNYPYDIDNLVARMKAGLDGIAEALVCNDRAFRLGEVRLLAVVAKSEGEVRVSLRPSHEAVIVRGGDGKPKELRL